MNSRQRIAAAVALEAPDRTPVAPLIDHFAAAYAGYTNAEIMADAEKRIAAVLKTMAGLGPWEMTFAADTANTLLLQVGVPARLKLPGRDLPADLVHQFEETEFLTPEDYDLLAQLGLVRFMHRVMSRLSPELSGPGGVVRLFKAFLDLRRHRLFPNRPFSVPPRRPKFRSGPRGPEAPGPGRESFRSGRLPPFYRRLQFPTSAEAFSG